MLDHEACLKQAAEMAQREVDRMYPADQVAIRVRKLEEFTNLYYRQMVTPPDHRCACSKNKS